ncbi:conserved exported hypothetical protein [Candidatus Sulfopaludibacter sp. SbA3]|nr:conserved exported hypothetical protein [Candidatus Sulfopaludibacter sp. SbA3]
MFLRSAIVLAMSSTLFAADAVPPAVGLTVHEWGTFTSIAAEDGGSQPWVSLSPPADLPCFVYHLSGQCIKCGLNRVRMETPVIYFYSPEPLTASVHVDLPSGLITEWYPQATHVSRLQPGMMYGDDGNIEWRGVQVSPGATPEFPNAGDRSHYYAARETDSDALRVGDQFEKVLFYRGIADFEIPIQPKFLPDGKLEIRNTGRDSVGFAVLFENRGGKIGYRVIHDLRGKLPLAMPDLTADAESVQRELATALAGAGLYAKEAAAMIETWRDSWFEEGMRIFYLVPRKMVDAELPLRIAPGPSAIERVFVGRVEVLSPAMRESIEAALGSGDTRMLAAYGRFLRPFCDRILQGNSQVHVSPAASSFLARASQPPAQSGGSPCRLEPSILPTEHR